MSRYVIAGLVVLGSLGFGYYLGNSNAPTEYINRTVEVRGEVQTQIVYRDRIVERTVTKYPNGTVVESDKTTDKDTTANQSSKIDSTNSVTQIVTRPGTNYSLGIRERLSYSDWGRLFPTPEELRRNLEITGGRRLLGGLWLDLGVAPGTREFTLGLRFEF